MNSTSPAAAAWGDPDNRRAWKTLFTWAVLGQILWPLVCLGSLLLIVGPEWPVWLLFIPLVYSAYRSILQRRYLVDAFQVRRILKQYPWQVHKTPESGIGKVPGAKSGDVWLKFPNPEQSGDLIPVILHGHVRSPWWRRRLGPGVAPEKMAQVVEIWFAGDVRFAGVLAVPGPRRLFVVYQRPTKDSRFLTDVREATPDALARARRAGVRVPERIDQWPFDVG
ncbi:hypothetical protein [Streptomyces sp. NPDC006012]|uniref:hypothetical protein n=1 Tax=Streptomyces sp. NPDC006012 TaxID=3364739 RepID=UPI003681670A